MILTILLATLLFLLAAAGLSIGLLITGKSKLKKGCNPNSQCDRNSCSSCDDSKKR